MYSDLFEREVPRLGFGCMRLPEGLNGEYIEEECQEMFDWAMSHGINYFDSAWHYIENQQMIGKCLAKYPRESYILVGKLCFTDGTLETRELAREAFEKELSDARTDYMDLELMHTLGSPGSLERCDREDMWGLMRALKESGRAKHIGFSFHSTPDHLERILSEHPEMEVVQIQANYYDHNTHGAYQNGGSIEIYEICKKYGKPIIIMEPVKGGNLALVDTHEDIKGMFAKADAKQSPAAWALRYAASLDGVVTVLSGMSDLRQMKENHRILMEDYKPLTEDEKKMLTEAAHLIESKEPVGCTACHYCTDKGCPAGIDIPAVLNSLNMLHQYRNLRGARFQFYNAAVGEGKSRPASCIDCASCETECPQHLSIRDLIHEADERLFAGENYDIWANHE